MCLFPSQYAAIQLKRRSSASSAASPLPPSPIHTGPLVSLFRRSFVSPWTNRHTETTYTVDSPSTELELHFLGTTTTRSFTEPRKRPPLNIINQGGLVKLQGSKVTYSSGGHLVCKVFKKLISSNLKLVTDKFLYFSCFTGEDTLCRSFFTACGSSQSLQWASGDLWLCLTPAAIIINDIVITLLIQHLQRF